MYGRQVIRYDCDVGDQSQVGSRPTAAASTARTRNGRGQGHQLREDLLAAAVQHLASLGSDEPVSLRAIARAAGVAPNAVYLHFTNRDDLLLAVLDRLTAQLADRRDLAERAADDAWDKLVARSVAYVTWGLAEPGAYRVLYGGRAVPRLPDPADAAFGQGMLDRTVELVAELEADGRASPVQDPQRTALLVWTILHGIVSLRIDKDTIDWPDPTELAVQSLVALVNPTGVGSRIGADPAGQSPGKPKA